MDEDKAIDQALNLTIDAMEGELHPSEFLDKIIGIEGMKEGGFMEAWERLNLSSGKVKDEMYRLQREARNSLDLFNNKEITYDELKLRFTALGEKAYELSTLNLQ